MWTSEELACGPTSSAFLCTSLARIAFLRKVYWLYITSHLGLLWSVLDYEKLQKIGYRGNIDIVLNRVKTFFLICVRFFIRISCLFTTGIRIGVFYLNMSHFSACKWCFSQVLGQKLRQSSHTSAKEWENNIKCFSFFFLFCFVLIAHYHIIRNVHLCHPNDSKQASFLSIWTLWLSTQYLLHQLTVLLISQLCTWIYIFIYTNNLVGRAELSRLFQFHFSWGEDSCCVRGLALVEAACVVYQWIMCMTLDYF